eukprot:358027-Chlamydomonas_euryale.AAC.4
MRGSCTPGGIHTCRPIQGCFSYPRVCSDYYYACVPRLFAIGLHTHAWASPARAPQQPLLSSNVVLGFSSHVKFKAKVTHNQGGRDAGCCVR